MKRLFRPITLWLATLVAVASALLLFEADLLWKVQMHNIFLDTAQFFHQSMAVPGGLLSWLGCYFSQHFYHPWVGTIVLCGWWLLLMWLTKRAFSIPSNKSHFYKGHPKGYVSYKGRNNKKPANHYASMKPKSDKNNHGTGSRHFGRR